MHDTQMVKVGCHVVWFGMFVLQLFFIVSECSVKTPVSSSRKILGNANGKAPKATIGVQLNVQHEQVVVDNGFVRVTLSIPEGMVTGIQYNGLDNLLEIDNEEDNRGYWDINWNEPGHTDESQRIEGTNFRVVMEDENQIELSFAYSWDSSLQDSRVPLNVDKRFVLLRGISGFYTYAIYERLEGWPDSNIDQTRIVFKLQKDKFHFMAVSDDRQRIMPMPEDRDTGQPLEYKEAVLLTNPTNPLLVGEVDDKYQYSCEDKDNRVHGWISFDPPVGFWMITPSDEFRTAGPIKQDLTSHVGPTTLSMFVSNHYAGKEIEMQFRNGEPWKKVFGPVFVYLNSVPVDENPLTLWEDAKEQMLVEVENWPYDFPLSEDFPTFDQRGIVSGQLLVHDWGINENYMSAANAYVGLALPGDIGSWQRETKGYQFWVQADIHGYFSIKGVRVGDYNLYAWVPGFIGDYRYDANITITPGCKIKLGILLYEPPRDGPTLWEIGIPDRTSAEFFVPDANPRLMNQLYINHQDKFRQYGLWERYAELYPDEDLTYTVGASNYQTDWFFAQVRTQLLRAMLGRLCNPGRACLTRAMGHLVLVTNVVSTGNVAYCRKTGNKTYEATTWQILFQLENVNDTGTYKLRIALASATASDLQVRFNDPSADPPHFTTGLIGKDNAIARHGIHGLYWLFSVDVPGSVLQNENNAIYLTQSRSSGPFEGVMYDYIRLEGPPS